MKRLLIATLAFISMSSSSLTPEGEQYCNLMAGLAYNVMAIRQTGLPHENVTEEIYSFNYTTGSDELNEYVRETTLKLMDIAYQVPVMPNDEMKTYMMESFSSTIYDGCASKI